MRTFFTISAVAAICTLAMSSCGSDTAPAGEKELVYEGSMAEPQIGEQPVAVNPSDSIAIK